MDWKEFLTKPLIVFAIGNKEEIKEIRNSKEFKKIGQNAIVFEK